MPALSTLQIHVIGEYDSLATMEVVGQRIILQYVSVSLALSSPRPRCLAVASLGTSLTCCIRGEHASFTDAVQIMLFTGELFIRGMRRSVHNLLYQLSKLQTSISEGCTLWDEAPYSP